jgi:hypothetical protein
MDEKEDEVGLLFEQFGVLENIDRQVVWKHQFRTISYHILTNEETLELIRRVAEFPPDDQPMREAELRTAYCFDGLDGKEVRIGIPKGPLRDAGFKLKEPELIARANWIHGWPGKLMDLVLANYILAADEPFIFLAQFAQDPNIDAERSSNGEPSTGSAFSDEDLSALANGLMSSSTPTKTPKKKKSATPAESVTP